jgi:hypothetical protein
MQRLVDSLLLGLEVVEEDGSLGRLLTPVLDNDARAVDNLSRVTLTVQNACDMCVSPSPNINVGSCILSLTETGPLAQLLAIGNLDQGDLVLGAQSNDQLLVGLLLAGLVQDAHVCLASVESLGSLTETAGETIVHEGELQDALQGIENGHLALGSLGGDLNLLGNIGGGVLFYVRLESGVSHVCAACSWAGAEPGQDLDPACALPEADGQGKARQGARKFGGDQTRGKRQQTRELRALTILNCVIPVRSSKSSLRNREWKVNCFWWWL